ncbi:MAG: DNA polymerase III subunit gamma/tau [Acidobacteria bacterium]|nr:DNA polymerase III subunit gamma/tau [Acidobacteriota bacterium]
MAYQVLARKYRPQLFSDVIGQDHVTRTLLNALAQNRIAHGYIFSGHRGIGKTTIARILAAALNCSTPVGTPERPTEEPCRVCVNCREISSASRQENSIFEESHSFDVEEIDAATNRGIDDARLLTAKIQTRPTNKSKYKIIILDEAHQITDAAWNALLKTLEEPPEWAVFMFATTQPEDIPQTIRSRCQHFSFHAVKLDDILGQLRFIATKEAITVDDATLTLLAEAGDGSMRDALSIMDQAIASAPLVDGRPHLEITQVRELMGSVSNVVYEHILEAVHANNSADVLTIVGRLLDAGNGAPQLARQFVRYLRNTIVAKVTNLAPGTDATGIAADLLQISPEERNRAARSASLFTEEELSRFLAIVLRTFDELGYRQEQRFHLELGLLKLVHVQRLIPIEDLLSQLGTKPTPTPSTTPTGRALTSAQPSPAATTPRTSSAPPSNPLSSSIVSSSPIAGYGAAESPFVPAPARPSSPPPSPFESDRSRKLPTASTSTAPAALTTDGSLALADHPEARPLARPEARSASCTRLATAPQPNPSPQPTAGPQLVSPASPAAEPFLQPTSPGPIHAAAIHAEPISATPILGATDPAAPDQARIHAALVAALAAVKGQQSASEQIEDATLNITGSTLEIQTNLSKTMLPVILNADAERILKAALREAYTGTLTLRLLPGTPPPSGTPRKPRQAASGSAAELAEKHPIVQEARRLFSAEISNVIDLRDSR